MRFTGVTMEAADPSVQGAFYKEVLDLPGAERSPDAATIVAGHTRVTFRRGATAGGYHIAFGVPWERFDEIKEWLRPRVELLRDEDRDEFDWDFWGARAVYFNDPEDNVLELICFRDPSPAVEGSGLAPWIDGVAEVGLPVADVAGCAEIFRTRFGIWLWDRDEPNPEGLTPVGRRGATFIVVPRDRPWFLGDVTPLRPLEVTLTGVRGGTVELDGHPYRITGAP